MKGSILIQPHSIDWTRVVRIEETRFPKDTDRSIALELQQRAHAYLSSHTWCREIYGWWLGFLSEELLGVFLADVLIDRVGREHIWVVVGDVPSLYLSGDSLRNPYQALSGYVGEAQHWIACVRAGSGQEGAAPLSLDVDRLSLDGLQQKLNAIVKHILDPVPHLL